jgi:hypothetical protein
MHVAQVGESSKKTRTRPASSLNAVRSASIPWMVWTVEMFGAAIPTTRSVADFPESL